MAQMGRWRVLLTSEEAHSLVNLFVSFVCICGSFTS
jgi:hypothetical protein